MSTAGMVEVPGRVERGAKTCQVTHRYLRSYCSVCCHNQHLCQQIVLHLLCTYLDSHLPLSPLSPDGRPFSSHYLLKYPDKPGPEQPFPPWLCDGFISLSTEAKRSEVALYQTSLHPPHYNVSVCLPAHPSLLMLSSSAGHS